jgi:hypothetical protein
VLVANLPAFRARYGDGPLVAGQYERNLDNSGNRILMRDSGGASILDFTFDDAAPWPTLPDGNGPSLVKNDVFATIDTWDFGDQWHAGANGGTPGAREKLEGDLNGDDVVSLIDLALLQSHFGLTPATAEQGDLSGDSRVGRADLARMVRVFSQSLPAAPSPPAPSPLAADAAIAELSAVPSRRRPLSTGVDRTAPTRRIPANFSSMPAIATRQKRAGRDWNQQ